MSECDGLVASPAEKSWRILSTIGGIAAFVAIAGMFTDIALSMLPGWEPSTVPSTLEAWFVQLSESPLLGLRNLDLLNLALSLIALPMYLALFGVHRETEPALAALGVMFVAVGTAVFVAGSAALPMLELSRAYAVATTAQQAPIEAAGRALLATGAHGSFGAYFGFAISEVGTLIVAIAMLRGRVFSKTTAWLGILGVSMLAVYTTATTFAPSPGAIVMAVAVPGGLLMIAWHALVGRGLLRRRADAF